MTSKFVHKAALAIAPVAVMGISMVGTSVARGDLKLSLQIAGATAATYNSPALGSQIEIDVWAQVTPNATYDHGASTQGFGSEYALLSVPYVVLNTNVAANSTGLSSNALEAWANYTGATPGTLVVDADGSNDLGTSSSAPQSDATAALASNAGGPSPYANGNTNIPAADQVSLPGGGYEFLLEKLYYTVTAADLSAGVRTVDYTVYGPHAGKTTANWIEDGNQDGTTNSTNDAGVSNKNSGNLTGSTLQLTIVTPEPASISMLGLGAAGLMARRRKA